MFFTLYFFFFCSCWNFLESVYLYVLRHFTVLSKTHLTLFTTNVSKYLINKWKKKKFNERRLHFSFLMLSIFVRFDSLPVFMIIKQTLQRKEQRTVNMLSTIMCMKTRYPLKCTVVVIRFTQRSNLFSHHDVSTVDTNENLCHTWHIHVVVSWYV